MNKFNKIGILFFISAVFAPFLLAIIPFISIAFFISIFFNAFRSKEKFLKSLKYFLISFSIWTLTYLIVITWIMVLIGKNVVFTSVLFNTFALMLSITLTFKLIEITLKEFKLNTKNNDFNFFNIFIFKNNYIDYQVYPIKTDLKGLLEYKYNISSI
ncbi:hypothetical protein [Spiroplasma sp. BIUS-1]|uniref:hypothetical protein n=1 Tax=Spiroplasma sp. BIUS-1 TaxID=216964 RepID=UPI0013972800|nr:hypothetical protein [Spiroplasma sp. BIUS-1]QHX36711.1 hypothetical protein SBIUS_v1c04580 [Spiroplasma sp. BIUS-1]